MGGQPCRSGRSLWFGGRWGVGGRAHSESSFHILTGGMPRSLQILIARILLISECLGIADLLLRLGLYHQE